MSGYIPEEEHQLEIVVVGSSDVNRRKTLKLIETAVTAVHEKGNPVHFYVPSPGLSDSEIPPVLRHLSSWIRSQDKSKTSLHVVLPESQTETEPVDDSYLADLEDYLTVTTAYDPVRNSVKALKGKRDRVFVVWDDEDEDCATALVAAYKRDTPVMDLTDDLAVLEPDESDLAAIEADRVEEVEETTSEDITSLLDSSEPVSTSWNPLDSRLEEALGALVEAIAFRAADCAFEMLMQRLKDEGISK